MQYEAIPFERHVSAGSAHVVVQLAPGWPAVPAPLSMQYCNEPW